MKRFSLIIAIIMVFGMLSVTAFAAEEMTISANDVTAAAGEEISFTFTIKNSPGIAGAQFSISYDSSVMSYVSAKSKTSSFYVEPSPNAGSNPVNVGMVNLSLMNITGDIDISEISFKVADNAKAGKYSITISDFVAYDSDVNEVACTAKGATLTVKGSGVVPGGNVGGTTVGTSKFTKQKEYTDSFTDVKEEQWFHKYVKTAFEYKLASGVSGTKFAPDDKFAVSHAITAAANIHSVYTGKTVRAAAQGEKWYVPYVEYCVVNGIIKEGQFEDYEAFIARGDMAVVFANVLPASEYNEVKSGINPDVTADMDCYNAVSKLYKAGIVSGDEKGNYNPDKDISRAEACVIFTRIAAKEYRAK